jgi:hypothetical protein
LAAALAALAFGAAFFVGVLVAFFAAFFGALREAGFTAFLADAFFAGLAAFFGGPFSGRLSSSPPSWPMPFSASSRASSEP